jgi:Septum formation
MRGNGLYPYAMNTTKCDLPHSAEVVEVLTMPGSSFPADSVFKDYKQKCRDALASSSSTAMGESTIDLAVMPPSEESWKQGDREVDA